MSAMDAAIVQAQNLLIEEASLRVEPSAATTLAAALAFPDQIRGECVLLLSGGNC